MKNCLKEPLATKTASSALVSVARMLQKLMYHTYRTCTVYTRAVTECYETVGRDKNSFLCCECVYIAFACKINYRLLLQL